MGDLQEVSRHVQERISAVQRLLHLLPHLPPTGTPPLMRSTLLGHDRVHAGCVSALLPPELPRQRVQQLQQELVSVSRLLEDFEGCLKEQKRHLKQLQEVDESYQRSLEDVHHLQDNMPLHLPRKMGVAGRSEAVQNQHQPTDAGPAEAAGRSSRTSTRQMELVTAAEFDSIPQYMRGRVSYQQLNAAVTSVNAAVAAKYRIVQQPARTLSGRGRRLQQRFREQEARDARGQVFVVDDDIREFTQTKVDKCFWGILNMLRHCQRLRELRGGGVTRYVLM